MAGWNPQADGPGDRALAKDFFGAIPRPLFSFCTYCGRPCIGLTCHRHRGLLALDPNMPHTESSVTTYPDFRPTCPDPDCREQNPAGNRWCCRCGTQLYLSENQLKGRAAA